MRPPKFPHILIYKFRPLLYTGKVIPSGHEGKPEIQKIPLILISGKFLGSFGKGHSFRARGKTETQHFSAYCNIRKVFVLLSSIRKGSSIRARGMTSDLFHIRCISEPKWVAPSGTRIWVRVLPSSFELGITFDNVFVFVVCYSGQR